MRACGVAVGLLAFVPALHAQRIRGVVQQPDSATVAAGIVIAVSNARGDVVARGLSNGDGTFDIQVPAAGSYLLRLLRVGFRPTVLDTLPVPASGVSGIRAVLTATPVMLAAVTVRSENVCGTTQDAGRVVAQLWEEARTALSAAELSVGSRTLTAEWQAFQFAMDRKATRARDQSVLAHRGVTERPFVSASAADLAAAGYAVQDGSAWTYRAPDAPALLSGEFAATHCFRVDAPSAARPQWIGIGFTPTPERRRAHDIAGTLWLDRATSEIRLLEFRYTNLPPEAEDPEVGGYVEYARMATGQWLVSRWALRMPRLVRRSVGGAAIPGGGRDDRTTIGAIDVTGGELLRVQGGGVRLFDADTAMIARDSAASIRPAHPSACGASMREGATLSGTVRRGSAAVGGAVVRVAWERGGGIPPVTLATIADARGAYRLPCVAPAVALTAAVSVGDVRGAPITIAPIIGRNAVVNLDLQPPPDR